MFHLFHPIVEFSRTHCLGICAFLVPANLLTSGVILGLVGWGYAGWLCWAIGGLSSLWAVLMLLHVLSWFAIGVVQMPTFVLCGLALVCLGINLWTIVWPDSLRCCLQGLVQGTSAWLKGCRWGRLLGSEQVTS